METLLNRMFPSVESSIVATELVLRMELEMGVKDVEIVMLYGIVWDVLSDPVGAFGWL
jgi:hypothetical protein